MVLQQTPVPCPGFELEAWTPLPASSNNVDDDSSDRSGQIAAHALPRGKFVEPERRPDALRGAWQISDPEGPADISGC